MIGGQTTLPGGQFGGTTGSFNGSAFNGGQANPKLTFEQMQERKKAMDEAKKAAKDAGADIAMNFKEGIQSVASGDEVGDYFQYALDDTASTRRPTA